MLAATIIVPTYDHGPTLFRSVQSALDQTVPDIEVFIVGDGAPDSTREIVADLQADLRVRYFEYPKGPRHGEIYRTAALSNARGEIVCYLGDDDLWMPTHVADMRALLEDADFAHSLPAQVNPDGTLTSHTVDLALAADRELILAGQNRIPLSCAAHTLRLFRRLTYGWRTTPTGTPTDLYMWQQILSLPGCRAVSGTRPTAINFPSPHRTTATLDERCAELDRYAMRLGDPAFTVEIYDAVVRDRARQFRDLRARVDELAACERRATAEIEARDAIIRDLQQH